MDFVHEAFEIREVKPKVFLFEFKNNYDMCMHFLRYQEYYESPSPEFRGSAFEVFDFMRWYSFTFGDGAFTYPDDWDGFNIPCNIIPDVWALGIPDRNKYDNAMYNAWKECDCKVNHEKFYIIGVVKGTDALDHEVAHAMFFLHQEYKDKMVAMVEALDPTIRDSMNHILKQIGYTSEVFVDETQAYFSTGLTESFGFTFKDKWLEERKPFKEFFKEYSEKINEQDKTK